MLVNFSVVDVETSGTEWDGNCTVEVVAMGQSRYEDGFEKLKLIVDETA